VTGALELYGEPITLYNEVLVLYGDAPPASEDRLGGAWLPVIYLDRSGNPVDLEAKIEAATEAVEEPEQVAAVEAVSGRMDDAKWIVENDMAREAEIVLQYLDKLDSYLAELIRRDIERAMIESDEQEAVAVLLLMN
jgi:hypothetical protein